MKRKILVAALAAMAMANSGFALAQGHDDRNDRDGRPGMAQPRGNPGPQRGGPMAHGPQRPPPGLAQMEGRGAGPEHSFYRGQRLPPEYRGRQGVVDDWRNHHLSAPPRGYHWVQTGADYVLVAIATGLIAQVLLGQ